MSPATPVDRKLPENYRLVYSQAQIAERVRVLAGEITTWAQAAEKQSGKQVLVVCVLRRGSIFFADLFRAIGCSVDMEFCLASSYSADENRQESGPVLVNLLGGEWDCVGRSILVVDDICDTGRTLESIRESILAVGVAEVKSAVMINRELEKKSIIPDWTAFTYTGPEWFVGFGLDDENRNSNLSDIYILENTGQENSSH